MSYTQIPGSTQDIADGGQYQITTGSTSGYSNDVLAYILAAAQAAVAAAVADALTGIMPVGGGLDRAFYENDKEITTNYTITTGKNAMSAGPMTVSATVTVPPGSTWTIVT